MAAFWFFCNEGCLLLLLLGDVVGLYEREGVSVTGLVGGAVGPVEGLKFGRLLGVLVGRLLGLCEYGTGMVQPTAGT